MSDYGQVPPVSGAERRQFAIGLVVVLALGAVIWVGYQVAQPGHDPRYAAPGFDSAYYVAWSDDVMSETSTDARFAGAFYRAPLYPYLLSLLRGPLGLGLGGVRWLQLLVALAATAALARVAFRQAGPAAGIATAALLVGYHPWLFFSARLLAEWVAIALLALSLRWIARRELVWGVLAAAALGLSALARPNLLLVGIGWVGCSLALGQRRKALVLTVVVAAVVLPVTAVNWQRSGHLVPISGNGGLTLYHGNGAGAEGVYTTVAGMSAAIEVQRAEATHFAAHRSGRDLDAIEADRYWAREALRERLADPSGTVVLAWNRLLLTLGAHEIALDEAPALDPNPWSSVAVVPFALIVALAAAGVGSRQARRGAAWSWVAIVACAATPLVFYVSSRYRLPLAVLLAVPAGAGVAELLAGKRRAVFIALGAAAFSLTVPAIASWSFPYAEVFRAERAHGLAGLASESHERSLEAAGEAERERWATRAAATLERARQADPESPTVWFVAGRLARHAGRRDEAEAAWLRAWRSDGPAPMRVAAAVNLSEIWINDGRAFRAEGVLREALRFVPFDENCWNNLIASLLAQGRYAQARTEIARARSSGVPVSAEIDALASGGG